MVLNAGDNIFDSVAPVGIGASDGGTQNNIVGKIHSVEIRDGIDGDVVTKTLRATDLIERLSPERPPTTFIDQLEWPSEKPLDRNGPGIREGGPYRHHSRSLGRDGQGV